MPQTPVVSSPDFAAELAVRLNEVAPDGFTVIADQENVVLRHGDEVIGSTGMAELVESSENLEHLPENLQTAARAILSNVQDWISDTSGEPWPGTLSQPNPDAKVVGGRLRVWFGAEESPVLELPPVELPRLEFDAGGHDRG